MTKDENLLKTGIFKKHALFSVIYKLSSMIIGYRKVFAPDLNTIRYVELFYFKHISDIKKSIFVRLYIYGYKGKTFF